MHFTYSTFLVLTSPFLDCFGPISYSLRNLAVNCTVLFFLAKYIFVLERDQDFFIRVRTVLLVSSK